MNRELLKIAVQRGTVIWQKHALERMVEREISRDNVKEILTNGEVIEKYPDDKPYPSALFLGWVENQPIHVVCSLDIASNYCFIITVYRPDLEHFESDYKRRHK